jgi:hypothetical protein
MKILAIEKDLPGVSAQAFTPAIKKAEAARVWELYQAGVFRELYFRQDIPVAVLVLECTDLTEAHTVLETLPLVHQGLIAFDLLPLAPYPGFSRLFEENALAVEK